jgi:hypothetical protein
MSIIARQSTARTVTVGPILDADGVAVTGAVVGALKIAKNGGAPAALNGSATLTHRNTGHYSLALTASDLDTVGQAEVVIDSTTNAMPIRTVTVVEEAVYDAIFAASAAGYQVPIWSSAGATVNLSSTTVATVTTTTTATTATNLTNLPTIPTNWITANGIAADAIGASELAADAVTEIVNGVADLFGSRVTAQTSSTSTAIILDAGASAVDDYYNGSVLVFTAGNLNGQARKITDYVGSTKTATVTAFTTSPANGDTAVILGRIE